jgi:exopolyphosphatase/guanosine-5'-triphosphate,3'-diphosphate pyrophosphatase
LKRVFYTKSHAKSKGNPVAKIGLVDLGTNSLRIEIYEVDLNDDSSLNRVHREVYMPRLGSTLYSNKSLNSQAKEQILTILVEAQKRLKEAEVDLVLAVATSALRESDEGAAFIEELNKVSGMSMEIISGEEEAYLIAQGILHFDSSARSQENSTVLCIDIGGGSTELSICENSRVLATASLALGAIRSHNTFLTSQPAAPKSVEQLRTSVRDEINKLPNHFSDKNFDLVFGSSGSIRTLCNLPELVPQDSSNLDIDSLSSFIAKLSLMNRQEIIKVEGLEENRADIILGGAIILEELLKHFQLKTITPSIFSLRHGLLKEGITQLQAQVSQT